MSACSGMCCSVFYFTASHEEVAAADYAITRGVDGPILKAMLVPLSNEQAVERANKLNVQPPPVPTSGHMYKCRLWDEKTKLCTQYERRPQMCRDYPYAGKCGHGCGFKSPPSVVDGYADKGGAFVEPDVTPR